MNKRKYFVTKNINKTKLISSSLTGLFILFLIISIIFIQQSILAQSGNYTVDINNDGKVDIVDIGIAIDNYGFTNPSNPRADVNQSGKVDIIDIGLLIDNYGQPQITPTPVPTSPPNTGGSFNFISWSDTEKSLTTLGQISNQALALGPEFTIYNGDAILGFPTQWAAAINGNNNNGMFNKTFAVRGNGDSGSNWTSAFDFTTVANNIGAKNYLQLTEDQTYSFDYGNSRFIGIDTPGCGSPSTTQLPWIEDRIKEAISLNLVHVFMFKHGPMYYVDNHPNCIASASFVSLISNYPIVTAIFHGHEHLKSHIPFGPADNRIPMSHPFHQIITGGAGDSSYPCNSSRLTGPNDYCNSVDGFGLITVNGGTVTVGFYQTGNNSPYKTISFTK